MTLRINTPPMLPEAIVEFEVPFRQSVLLGSRWTPPLATRTAVLLHGGGVSSADGFQELRDFLYDRNIATVAFDSVGHGRTGGVQAGTTLEDRVQQVWSVVRSQGLQAETLALIGFSMGAYVAVKAGVGIGVSRLCLAIPAAYASQAYQVPFGPRFSEILRTPRSWAHSDAFDAIRAYAGHLLVVSAGEDKIVPSEIPQTYLEAGSHCASAVHHIVRRSGHNLSAHYEHEPQARVAAYTEIASLCLRDDVEGSRVEAPSVARG